MNERIRRRRPNLQEILKGHEEQKRRPEEARPTAARRPQFAAAESREQIIQRALYGLRAQPQRPPTPAELLMKVRAQQAFLRAQSSRR